MKSMGECLDFQEKLPRLHISRVIQRMAVGKEPTVDTIIESMPGQYKVTPGSRSSRNKLRI